MAGLGGSAVPLDVQMQYHCEYKSCCFCCCCCAEDVFCAPPLFVPLNNLTGFVRQVTLVSFL